MQIRLSTFRSRISIFFLGVILAACGQDEKQKQVTPPTITVVEVLQQDVPIYNKFVGQLFGEEDVAINARVEGFLTGIHFTEGTEVKKGQLLYSIDPEPFRAALATEQSKVAQAQTILINAENELARYKPLAAKDAVSQSDLDYAQANRDASLAAVEAAKASLRMAQINLSYTQIKSPINGFIGKTNARVGEFVGRSPSIVLLNTVSKVNNVRAQFFLTESQYLVIAREVSDRGDRDRKTRGEQNSIDIRLTLSDGSIHPYPGKVDFVNREVDATTGAILVQATFPNTDFILKPGQYAKVVIMMSKVAGALLIPQRCIKEIQGQYSVFVVEEGNKVNTRQIKISERFDDLALVTDGLNAGDKIVIDAIQKVQSGLIVEPKVIKFESKSPLLD